MPVSTIHADDCDGGVFYGTDAAALGVWYQPIADGRLSAMSLDDDLYQTAVAAAERAIQIPLWDVSPSRRQQVAEAAVQAAAPFLDGTERTRVLDADSGRTVTS